MKSLLLSLVVVFATTASVAEELIPIDEADSRVVAEIAITVSSDALPAERTDTLYFVPAALATKEERVRRCAQMMAGVNSPNERWSWGYSVSVLVEDSGMSVELASWRIEERKEIWREISFPLQAYADVQSKRAGLKYQMSWKKVQPAATDQRP